MSRKFDTKLTKVADEFADFDLFKPKDHPSPQFRSQETESMFILTMHLQGYKRMDIKVEINEDGSVIALSGEISFQDTLRVGGHVVKKDVEMRGFRKAFKIPQGVVLDKIKVRFNEDDSELVIRMPKATKGLIGVRIEELKTKKIKGEFTKPLQVYTKEELTEQENQEKKKERIQDEEKMPRKRFKICTPVIFGSAFFMSLIVLFFHLVQSEKPVEKKKEEKSRLVCSYNCK